MREDARRVHTHTHTHSWHHNVKFLFTGEWPSDLHTLDTGQHAYFGFESISERANPVDQLNNEQCEIREQMQIVALESSHRLVV